MIQPLRGEVERYGHYSLAAESMYDQALPVGAPSAPGRTSPASAASIPTSGSAPTWPSRAPWCRSRSCRAIPFLAKTELAFGEIANELKANRLGGVPYTDEMIAQAETRPEGAGDAGPSGQSDLEKRCPKAQSRDFDGDPRRITEADALIAYLQALGALVDFKLYDDKANIR